MAEREIVIRGRRLSQLKVDELKQELELRGLRKSGNKGVLIERLQEAIDKELEQKEGYQNFPALQEQKPPANTWLNPPIQQQQQQHSSDFPRKPMSYEQHQPQQQALLNQPIGMLNQQYALASQQQHMMQPAQVGEFREQWPQAQMQQPPAAQPQLMQPQIVLPQMTLAPGAEFPAMTPQAPQLTESEAQYSDSRWPQSDDSSLPQPSNHHVAQLAEKPEVVSSSSSDNEQDSMQQSSSSSSSDSDNNNQEKPTSLLNLADDEQAPVETIQKDVEEKEPVRSEEGKGEIAMAVTQAEMDTPLETEAEEKIVVDSTSTQELPTTAQENQEEGELAEGDGKGEENELPEGDGKEEENELPEGDGKEEENEKESFSEEKEIVPQSPKKEQFSPTGENSFEVEPSEEDKAVVEERKVLPSQKSVSPAATKKRKISIPRTSLQSTPTSDGQPSSRKRRWGLSSSSKKKTTLSISTDSLKDLIPGVQVHSTPALEAVMDLGGDDNDDDDEEEENVQGKKPEEEKEPEPVATPEAVEPETKRRKDRIVKVEEKKTIKLQRKPVAIEKGHEPVEMEVKEEPEAQTTIKPYPGHTSNQQQETSPPPTENRLPSPARFPESEAIHLKNLVRPFTLNQLKDLLRNYGPLVEDGFWIDKIKSHCYVVYTNVNDASSCRQGLHGIKWPSTSPKILSVDFADEDEMARDTEGLLGKAKEMETEVKTEKPSKKEQTVEKAPEDVVKEEDDQRNAGNLLDNLFRKTKTTPCLYWLPLSDEQIATRDREREERRKARQEERKKEEEAEQKERLERQQQREKEREKEKREREAEKREPEKRTSRSPTRNRRRERSRSRSRSPPRGPARRR
ncbi:uncharacterized protein LOC141876217 [Acropora palmata]|uniref:uncharacterized protein LOC141876217 n=1 Tax=Acropora palmata TaxID=6131 RepID=UPI003DA027B8